MASPASPAFAPPPPPAGTVAPTPTPPAAHSQPPWALTLALGGAVLAILGWSAWAATLLTLVQEKAGPNANQEQIDQAARDLLVSGQAPPMPATTLVILLVGVICSISGLVLAIRSLLRLQERRGMAIAACIISVCFLVCQILPMLAALTAHQAASAS